MTRETDRTSVLDRLVSSCLILRFLFVAVFACVAIAAALYVFMPLWNQWTPDVWLKLSDGNIRGAVLPRGAEWVLGASTLVMVSLMLWRVQRMLQFVADEKSPFRPQVYSALKFVARTLILLPIVPTVLAFAAVWICVQAGFQGSFAVTSIFKLDTILIGIILHVVANVFEYGCILQTQDDGLI